jgi:hypothetical protein
MLPNIGDYRFTLADLQPHFEQRGTQYGIDFKIVAAVAYQESGFKNWLVHLDGTGHGLFGLDDNGLLPDFERWSNTYVGRGISAGSIPPERQIEYATMKLAEYARIYGDPYTGAQVWHRGPTLWPDQAGQNYNRLIRQHMRDLFGG